MIIDIIKRQIFSLTILITAFKTILFSQPYTYYWQNPYPQGNPLFNVHAFDTSYAMTVGTVGTIMKTTNGGADWNVTHKVSVYNTFTNAEESTESWVWSIHFYNRSIGWAVGGNGTIMKTENGGVNWTRQFSGTTATLQSVYFINMFVGWAVGWNGVILKTRDAGITWENQNSNSQAYFFSTFFLNDSIGWAVGERGITGGRTLGEVVKTTDGGNTWKRINIGLNNRLWSFYYKYNICWITGWGGLIDKSTDMGNSFTPMKTNITDLIYAIDFPSEKIGYAGGEFGQMLKTTDGGETWSILKAFTEENIYSISFIDNSVGWVVGEYGIIYKTRDGGNTWEQQSKKLPGLGITKQIKSVSFSENSGWAVGDKGLILRTTNNGFNWTDLSYNSANYYNGVSFPNKSTGFIVGNNGKILKTTNGGDSWNFQPPPDNNANYNAVQFLNEYTGYIIGDFGSIYKTTNGGITWNGQNLSSMNILNAIHFVNQNTGYIAGDRVVLKTTDGGANFEIKSVSTNILSMKFYNEIIGWATGNDGTIIKTTDGGNNWLTQAVPTKDEITCLYITDPQNVWAVGKWGRLFRTMNGGTAWEMIQTNTSNFLNGLYFPEKSMGIIFGKGGTIMRFYDGAPKPIIIADPDNLSFVAEVNGSLPQAQVINISSIGGIINWNAVKDTSSWLIITRMNNTRLLVQINSTNLFPGIYTAAIDIIDSNALNSPQKINITYYLYAPGEQPEIDLGGTSILEFEAEQNSPILPDNQSFKISNIGKGIFDWKLSKDVQWLDYTPGQGKDSATINVSINTTKLPVGFNVGKIIVTAPAAKNSPQEIDVIYGIYPSPTITLTDTVLDFTAVQNGRAPDSKNVVLSNPGRRSLTWTAIKTADWLSFSPLSGGNNDTIIVKITNTNLNIGQYQDRITLTSLEAVNSPVSILITYTVTTQSQISFPQDSVVFQRTELGDSLEISITIANPGSGILNVNSLSFIGLNANYFSSSTLAPFSVPIGGTKTITFRFKPKRRGRLIATLEIKSNAITQDDGTLSRPFIGYGIDTKPPQITANWDSPIKYGDSAAIKNATAVDYSGINQFKLEYRQSNELWDPNSRKRDFPSNENVTQYIPTSSVNQHGVDFRIIAEDSAGNADTLSNPISTQEKPIKFFSIPVKIADKKQIGISFTTPNVTQKGDEAKVSYKMFSPPIIFDNVTAKDLWGHLGAHKYQWRFRVPGYPNLDGKNFNDGENEVLKNGVTYFIITRNETTIEGTLGETKRFDQFYVEGIDLQPGYNYIGNPFTFEIPINKLRLQDTNQQLKNSSWYYDGSSSDPWLPNKNFQVWGGYCVKVINPTKLFVEEEIPEKERYFSKISKDGWELQIIASDGETFDSYNYIGMKNTASDQYDYNDIFEPPKFEGGISLYFPHNNWGKYSSDYSGDFRKSNSEGATWDFEITSDKNKLIYLKLGNPENLPKDFEFVLFDRDYSHFIPLTNNLVKFGNQEGLRHLRIIVGKKEYVISEKSNSKIIPAEFKLFQNYPNPFNPQTTIFYQIPVDGFVTLEIYSILGNSIQTLIKENQKAGSYEISFDIKSVSGGLASGVYFYRLKVTGEREFSEIRKLVVLK